MNKREKEIIDAFARDVVLASEDCSFMVPGEVCKKDSGIHRVIMAEFLFERINKLIADLKAEEVEGKGKKAKASE